MSTWVRTRKLAAASPPRPGTCSGAGTGRRGSCDLALEACRREGRLIPKLKSRARPDGLRGRLTPPDGAFAGDPRLDRDRGPLWVHRSAVATGRNAAKAHDEHGRALAWKVGEALADGREWSAWIRRALHDTSSCPEKPPCWTPSGTRSTAVRQKCSRLFPAGRPPPLDRPLITSQCRLVARSRKVGGGPAEGGRREGEGRGGISIGTAAPPPRLPSAPFRRPVRSRLP